MPLAHTAFRLIGRILLVFLACSILHMHTASKNTGLRPAPAASAGSSGSLSQAFEILVTLTLEPMVTLYPTERKWRVPPGTVPGADTGTQLQESQG